MAKAIFGYLNGPDPRAVANVAADNRRLRDRVTDLEALVARLQQENDALAAAAMDAASSATGTSRPSRRSSGAEPSGGGSPRDTAPTIA